MIRVEWTGKPPMRNKKPIVILPRGLASAV